MRFSKKFSYKLSKPFAVLALAGSGLVMGCSKDDPKNDIVPQHDTVYTFGRGWYDNLTNLTQISASADSTEVRRIIFQLDTEKDNWAGLNMKGFVSGFEKAFQAAKGKGEGRGVFKNVTNQDANHEIESQYNAWGFQFEFYKPAAQAMQKAR